MDTELNTLKNLLTQSSTELNELLEKFVPMQKRKSLLEEKIEKYKELISISGGAIEEIKTTNIENKVEDLKTIGILSPMEAYKKIIVSFSLDKTFNEEEVRNIANKAGVLTRKNNNIDPATSRSMFAKLKKMNVIYSTEKRGLYKRKMRRTLFPE